MTSPAHRSLLPREHGVYAEVLFPLLTACALQGPSWNGLLLAVAIVAAFLLHEPVLVLLGRRGSQARRIDGRRARRRTLLLVAGMGTCGAIALWHAGSATRWSALALLPALLLLTVAVATKRERSMWGEGLVAVSLSAAAVPVALACGVPLDAALTAAAIWSATFLLGTGTVHVLFARSRGRTRRPAILLSVGAAGMVLVCVGIHLGGGPVWSLAVVPAALVSLGSVAFGLSPKRLRLLGWTLVSSNVITLAILIAGHTPATV